MPDSQEVQPHEQDDCDDCQKQRAENNQLIGFYERLNKIKEKVTKIKPNLMTHGTKGRITETIAKPPHLELGNVDQKQMGYELACALLEREIKIKRENELLNLKIREMKKANAQLNEEANLRRSGLKSTNLGEKSSANSFYFTPQHSHKSKEKQLPDDSLDSAIKTERKNQNFWGVNFKEKRESEMPSSASRYSDAFTLMENTKTHTNSSSLSHFEETERSSYRSPDLEVTQIPKYEKMNLWLYNLNVEEQTPLFSGKKPNSKPKY